jgi:hypothetical protein
MSQNDILYRRGDTFTLAIESGSGAFHFICGSGSGIQSDKFDLGEPHADEYEMFTEITTVGAPTAGLSYDFYLSQSVDNTNFAGNVAGATGDYMTPTTINNFLPQLNWLGSLMVFNSGGTTQRQSFVIRPVTRYAAFVMYNGTDTAVQSSGSKITLTPLIPQFQNK